MTEEEFKREERDEAALDPNAVINVKDLAHRRQVDADLPPTPWRRWFLFTACVRGDINIQALCKGLSSHLVELHLDKNLQLAGSCCVCL